MPTMAQLQTAVSNLLGLPGIGAALHLNNQSRERAFEAYVFSLVVQAVRNAGGTVVIRGIQTGPNPPVVVFRGAPGMLGSTAQNYAYADCTLEDESFEIHVDVKYTGSSTAPHEADVSIVDHDAAGRIRGSPNEFPKARSVSAVIECKCYDANLGVVLGRTFVGLVNDCGVLKLHGWFATNGHHPILTKYLTSANKIHHFMGLTPADPDVEARFLKVMEQDLRKWAKIG